MRAHSPTPTEGASGYPMKAQIPHESYSPIIPTGGLHRGMEGGDPFGPGHSSNRPGAWKSPHRISAAQTDRGRWLRIRTADHSNKQGRVLI
jgi:hypothetical protein